MALLQPASRLIDEATQDDDSLPPLRVLHVVATGQRRGAELFASELVTSLDEGGIDQHVAVLRSSGADGVSFDAETSAWRDGRPRLPGLRVSGATLRALRGLVRSFEPDLIQAHGGEALKYVALVTRPDGPRIVYRRIGSTPPWVGGKARRRAHAGLMRRAARIVTLSDSLRRQTIDAYRLDPDRVVTIPRAVHPRRVAPIQGRDATRAALRIPGSAKVVLSLGALTREKDPLAHLDIADRVFTHRTDTFHVFAGDGPLRRELEAQIERRGIADQIRVLGNRSDVGDLLAASEVMILASATEGMPGCLIEAGLAGVVAAAYAVGAVPEVIQNGVTGLVVAPGDKDALTGAILTLLEQDDLRDALGRAAHARCLERFDARRIAPKYLDLYREVTNDSAASRQNR